MLAAAAFVGQDEGHGWRDCCASLTAVRLAMSCGREEALSGVRNTVAKVGSRFVS